MTASIEQRTTPGRGNGIFALRSFRRGEIVLIGELDETPIKNHSHASQLGKTKFGFHKGLSSKFNHSCDPNCGIVVNDTGGHNVVAICEILADEETTYDYAMRNYAIEHFPDACVCGAANCRASITGWRDLPEPRKEDYAGFIAPYLIEMDLENAAAEVATAAVST